MSGLIGGYVNTQRLEIINFQLLAIKLLPHETYETMSLIISSCSALDFEKSSVCRTIILLSDLIILFISATCFFMRLMSLWTLEIKPLQEEIVLKIFKISAGMDEQKF